ncbi:hypothetical protein SBBP2_410028 [Burkholderiales bacterium]|nr:hypothetical protein SBBP2_410028 [Burkholderiales bacterium]
MVEGQWGGLTRPLAARAKALRHLSRPARARSSPFRAPSPISQAFSRDRPGNRTLRWLLFYNAGKNVPARKARPIAQFPPKPTRSPWLFDA